MGSQTEHVTFDSGTEDVKRLKSIIDQEWDMLNNARMDARLGKRWRDETRELN